MYSYQGHMKMFENDNNVNKALPKFKKVWSEENKIKFQLNLIATMSISEAKFYSELTGGVKDFYCVQIICHFPENMFPMEKILIHVRSRASCRLTFFGDWNVHT
jgi:hypothetical protein